MTAGPWVLVNDFATNLEHGLYPLGANYSVVLVTSASNIGPTSTLYSALTGEVATGGGYTVGGIAVTLTDNAGTTDAVYFASSPGNPIWTATGSGITSMYAVLKENTNGYIVGYTAIDDVSSTPTTITVPAGNTLEVESDNTSSNPVYTI